VTTAEMPVTGGHETQEEPVTGGTVRLVATGPQARDEWGRLAVGAEGVAATQTPAWLDAVCAASGSFADATRLYETADGRHLVLPLARRRGRPGPLSMEESWPEAWEFGGLLASSTPRERDIRAVVHDLMRRSVLRTHVRVRTTAAEADVWERAVPSSVWRNHRPTHVLDLSGGFDTVWTDRFTSKVRSTSRKAVKRGVTVESDATGRLVPLFDALYRKSVERWARERREPVAFRRWLASRREPLSKWATVASVMGEACRVWIAFRGGVPIAGVVVLSNGDQAAYWRGAMDKELTAGTGANELLHHSAIEDACSRGVRQYDFGTSPSVSLARFKATFGARPEELAAYRFERVPMSRLDWTARSAVKRMVRIASPDSAENVHDAGHSHHDEPAGRPG